MNLKKKFTKKLSGAKTYTNDLLKKIKKISGAKTYTNDLLKKIKKFAGLETEKIDVDALINIFAEKFDSKANVFIKKTGNEGEELKNIYNNLDTKQQEEFRKELKDIVGDGINVNSKIVDGVVMGTLIEYRHVKSLPGSDKLEESTKVRAAYEFSKEKKVDYIPIATQIAKANFGTWYGHESGETGNHYYVRVNNNDVEISEDQYKQILDDILKERSISKIKDNIIGMIYANKDAEIIAKNKVLQERANIENEIRRKYPYIEYSTNPGGYIEAFIELNKELQMQNNKHGQGSVNDKIYALQEQLAKNVAGRFYGVSVSYNDREGRYEYYPNEQFYNNAIKRVKSGGIFKDIEQMQRQRDSQQMPQQNNGYTQQYNGQQMQRQGNGNQPAQNIQMPQQNNGYTRQYNGQQMPQLVNWNQSGNGNQPAQNIQMQRQGYVNQPAQNIQMPQSQSLTDKIKEAGKRVDVAKKDVQPPRSNNNNKSNKQRENNKAKGNLTNDR